MNVDKVAIGNMALAHLGSKPVQSFEQPNVASIALKQVYDEARLQCLTAQLWNFASSWAKGIPLAIEPKPGWSYVFAYPPGALRVFEILRASKEEKEIPFEVTARPDSLDEKIIHCNAPEPVWVFNVDRENPATFDWDFIHAFSWALAEKIAMPVTKSVKLQQNAAKQFAGLLDVATARTKNENKVDTDTTPSYQAVR